MPRRSDAVRTLSENLACEVAGLTVVQTAYAGTTHNFTNTGSGPLRLVTIYGPPDHAPDTVHRTKAEGEAAEAEGEDDPPEPS